MVKAYDRVSWDILKLVLLQVGLILEATNWIMWCINLANFVVLVNGKPSYFFKRTRDLFQGCMLSTLLFIFIIESLSRVIHKVKRDRNIQGVNITKLIKITHFLFIDDVILFGDGSVSKLRTYHSILDICCKATGNQWYKILFSRICDG